MAAVCDRQVILAAAGIYALDNHVERLKEDHQHAKLLANALSAKDFVGEIFPVETNIVIFEVRGRFTPQQFAAHMNENNILVIAISSTQVRIVTHLDITSEMVERTVEIINVCNFFALSHCCQKKYSQSDFFAYNLFSIVSKNPPSADLRRNQDAIRTTVCTK